MADSIHVAASVSTPHDLHSSLQPRSATHDALAALNDPFSGNAATALIFSQSSITSFANDTRASIPQLYQNSSKQWHSFPFHSTQETSAYATNTDTLTALLYMGSSVGLLALMWLAKRHGLSLPSMRSHPLAPAVTGAPVAAAYDGISMGPFTHTARKSRTSDPLDYALNTTEALWSAHQPNLCITGVPPKKLETLRVSLEQLLRERSGLPILKSNHATVAGVLHDLSTQYAEGSVPRSASKSITLKTLLAREQAILLLNINEPLDENLAAILRLSTNRHNTRFVILTPQADATLNASLLQNYVTHINLAS